MKNAFSTSIIRLHSHVQKCFLPATNCQEYTFKNTGTDNLSQTDTKLSATTIVSIFHDIRLRNIQPMVFVFSSDNYTIILSSRLK
jgi:hypothetical protein